MEGLRGAFAGQFLSGRQMPCRTAKLAVQTSCVATPVKPPSAKPAKRSKVEIVKEKSDFLRHPLMQELVNENSYINEDAVQLMKFHGSYQQDHREKRAFGQGKFYQFMMRTRQPGGVVPNQLYLTMDDLSEQVRQLSKSFICCCVVFEPVWSFEQATFAAGMLLHLGRQQAVSADKVHAVAVWQWYTAPDHQAGVPVAWGTQKRLEDSLLICYQEHGFNTSCMWGCQQKCHVIACALQESS